jgi:alpha-amylase
MGSETTGSGDNVVLTDGWRKLAMKLSSTDVFLAMVYPIETVTQSEDGFERTYQGTSLVLTWPISLGEGEQVEFDTTLTIRSTVGA